MDALAGAVVAVAVGWTTILAAVRLPVDRVLAPRRLRHVGAVTLGLVGLSALGVPLPTQLPLGVLVVGLAAAAFVDGGPYLTLRHAMTWSSSCSESAGLSPWFMSTSWEPQSGQIGLGNPMTDPRPMPGADGPLSKSYSGASKPQSSHRKMKTSMGTGPATPCRTFNPCGAVAKGRGPGGATVPAVAVKGPRAGSAASSIVPSAPVTSAPVAPVASTPVAPAPVPLARPRPKGRHATAVTSTPGPVLPAPAAALGAASR